MAKRLINTPIFKDGRAYRIEVVDLLAPSGTNPDYKVQIAFPGITISYEGDVNQHTTPVMGSSMSFTAFLTQAQRDHVLGIMYSDTEYALAAGFYVTDEGGNEHLEWCGLVLPDETGEMAGNGSGYINVTFNCTDGLPILKHKNFLTPDAEPSFYSGERRLSFWVRECLKKLPHWNYYFAATAQTYLKEVGLPIPSDDTYDFDISRSTLDSSYVKGRTFYGAKKPLNTKRRLPVPSDTFSSTYAVLEDIMLAVGGSMVLTKGVWYVINRSYLSIHVAENDPVNVSYHVNINPDPYFEVSDTTESFVINIDDEQMPYLAGASRKGVFPFRGATMIHKSGGSDLIFASGVGYEYGSWQEDYPLLNEAIFNVTDGDWDQGNLQMSNVGKNENQPDIVDLNVAAGDQGVITIAMTGYLSYDKFGPLNNEVVKQGIGACPVLRQRIRIVDSNGKSWRLKRHVLTMNDFQVSIDDGNFNIDIGEVPTIYYPKYYEDGGAYDWIGDDEPDYDGTYFETMIGMDPDSVIEGSTERFLEIDFQNTKFYTPIKTEVKKNDEGSDNVLTIRNNKDRSRYLWRMNSSVFMPDLPSGFISEFHWDAHQLLVYKPNAGPRPTGDGTYSVSPSATFFTAPNIASQGQTVDGFYAPDEYIVYGCTVKVGDGESTSDIQYVAFDNENNGTEIHNIGETRIGSSFVNRSTGSNGKIWAALYDNGVQLETREDNLYWSPRYDPTEKSEALLYLNCADLMHMRHKTRQMVSGSILQDPKGNYNTIIRPINILKTSVFRGIDEYLMPCSLTFDLDQVSVESLVVGFDRDALLESIEAYDNSSVGSGKGPNLPGVNDGANDGPGGIASVKNLLIGTNATVAINSQKISDNEFDIANVTQAVNQVISKTDLITVSSPVNLDNISIPDLGDIEIFTIFLEK